uniref:Uncharacterized protein n=1 Tax=Rangifer tarandus platyrhynchus TaxID=3082113 RepID=A0ACB0EU80_RANTA|nr:unnamed protein product [Rangifer tarandus platyrhynchus]
MSSTLPHPAGTRRLDRGLVGALASEQPGGQGSQRSPRTPWPLATSAFELRFHRSRHAGTNAAMETRRFPGAGTRSSCGRRGARYLARAASLLPAPRPERWKELLRSAGDSGNGCVSSDGR